MCTITRIQLPSLLKDFKLKNAYKLIMYERIFYLSLCPCFLLHQIKCCLSESFHSIVCIIPTELSNHVFNFALDTKVVYGEKYLFPFS